MALIHFSNQKLCSWVKGRRKTEKKQNCVPDKTNRAKETEGSHAHGPIYESLILQPSRSSPGREGNIFTSTENGSDCNCFGRFWHCLVLSLKGSPVRTTAKARSQNHRTGDLLFEKSFETLKTGAKKRRAHTAPWCPQS